MSENTLNNWTIEERKLSRLSSNVEDYFQDYAISSGPLGNVLPVATDALCNVVRTPLSTLYCNNINAQTLLCPTVGATGISIAGDLTNTDGFDITLQPKAQTDARFIYTIGTDKPFFIEAQFTVSDVSGVGELLIGFRKNEAYAAARATYADYFGIGLIGAKVELVSQVAGGGETITDTTMTVADAGVCTFRMEVDTNGVAKVFVKKASTVTTFVVPTVSLDYTFTSALNVVPFIRFIHGADVCDTLVMNSLKAGYLM